MGGEKEYTELDSVRRLGSPPRGRGKVFVEVVHDLLVGITPAWAGKSLSFWPIMFTKWDHPRVGGEK